ncbi:MAG: hypothetical protein GF393_04885 [Armatimonadia bacterium]|nr:hypothetical protein [Armatimonadia bacterium]
MTPAGMRIAAWGLSALLVSACCAAGNPVTNGGFEALDEQGEPVDWELLGDCSVTDDAHSGENAMLLQRESAEGLCGLNRVWQPGNGQRGTMLSELSGGIRFWYRAEEATDPDGLVFYVIPMSDEPLEVGGLRASYTVPPQHVGDGRWHEGAVAYDYADKPGIRWVHVSPRLRGSRARLILDDIAWVDHVGPMPAVKALELRETAGLEGRECVVEATLTNSGDRPAEEASVSITLPDGLSTEGQATREVRAMAPGETVTERWTVTGERDTTGEIDVTFRAGERVGARVIGIEPALELVGLLARRSVLGAGESTQVDLLVRNSGNATVTGIVADLAADRALEVGAEGTRRTLAALRPQQEAKLSWRLTAREQSPAARAQASVRAENAEGAGAATELVSGPRLPRLGDALSGPVARVAGDVAVIGSDSVRMVFPRAEFGWGMAIVQRQSGDTWQTVATMPRLTKLATQGRGESSLIYADSVRAIEATGDITPGLEFVAEVQDAGGATWAITQTVSLLEEPTRFRLSVIAVPDRAGQVLALDGPVLLAGDGAPGGPRRLDAIFPGLEWLVEGEVSSSALDIAPDHPHRIRYVPHPHMVTVPMMCARFKMPRGPNATVLYSWDHLRPYFRDMNRPSPMFASPDRFAGRAATAMGIFAPSMPDYIEANARVGHTPLEVAPGEEIGLVAEVSVLDSGEGETALEAVRQWFAQHGVPEPNPLPHGETLTDEVEFDMAAYLRSLWVEDEAKWVPIFFGPPDWRTPQWKADFLYDVRMGARLTDDEGLARRLRERDRRVVELSGIAPVADDMGFQFAGPAARVMAEYEAVQGLMGRQRDDGSWRFHARIETGGVFKGRDYGELGPDDAAEVGTCARNAWRLLRFARMTGDASAREAGLEALAFMERFEVPRAAQVWEVPVHTPDILASADACEAYLEGFRLTGDRAYLDRAVYWAWTGLPFVYTWDVPGFEFVKHASIPVFGATWYTGSWFGRPVQWNGLVYARALLQLADYDDTLDWRTIAEGITVSAMYQQYTDAEHQALWPDAISAIDRRDSGANFAPRRILHNMYRMMGMQPAPVTAAVPTDDGPILISAAGEVASPGLREEALSFELTYQPPQTGFALVCNVSRPESVSINGSTAREVDSPADMPAPCWRYLQDTSMLELRLNGSGTHSVDVRGVAWKRSQLGTPPISQLRFDFDHDAEGWRPSNDLDVFHVRDGILHTQTTGGDPYMVRSNCRIDAAGVAAVRVRMALDPGMSEGAQLFWTTAREPGMSQSRSLHFDAVADGEVHELLVPVAGHPGWVGTITGLRLDPAAGQPFGHVRIDSIASE